MHKADAFLTHMNGPFATVRSCLICGKADIIRGGRGSGRGFGMREGNKSRGRMIQHVKAEHPDELSRVPDNWFHSQSNWFWKDAT